MEHGKSLQLASSNTISVSSSTVGGDVVAGDKLTVCINIINQVGNTAIGEVMFRQTLTDILTDIFANRQAPEQIGLITNVTETNIIFLHYFDHYFLEMKTLQPSLHELGNECRLATRLAILIADQVFLPASSYFESVLCRSTIDDFSEIFQLGIIWLVGSAESAWEYRDKKLSEYSKNSKQYLLYSEGTAGTFPPFWNRSKSATQEIASNWVGLLDDSSKFSAIASDMIKYSTKNFEQRWVEMPTRLEHLAFVVQHVVPLLFDRDVPRGITQKLHLMINDAYFTSFCEELHAGVVRNLAYLRSELPSKSCGRDLNYTKIVSLLVRRGLLGKIRDCSVRDLMSLKFSPEWMAILAEIICTDIPQLKQLSRSSACP